MTVLHREIRLGLAAAGVSQDDARHRRRRIICPITRWRWRAGDLVVVAPRAAVLDECCAGARRRRRWRRRGPRRRAWTSTRWRPTGGATGRPRASRGCSSPARAFVAYCAQTRGGRAGGLTRPAGSRAGSGRVDGHGAPAAGGCRGQGPHDGHRKGADANPGRAEHQWRCRSGSTAGCQSARDVDTWICSPGRRRGRTWTRPDPTATASREGHLVSRAKHRGSATQVAMASHVQGISVAGEGGRPAGGQGSTG